MYNEIRISQRKAIGVAVVLIVTFVYVLNRNSCEPENVNKSELKSELPIIYAITPTYYRPVQQAELTR